MKEVTTMATDFKRGDHVEWNSGFHGRFFKKRPSTDE
jgi:hypothetical protein